MALFRVTVPAENFANLGPSSTQMEITADDFIADERGVHFTKGDKYVAYFPRLISLLRISD